MKKLLLLIALTACSKTNPYYCEGAPDDNCLLSDGSMQQGCTTSAQCTTAAKPVCEPTQMICVACADGMTAACTGTTPVCAGNTCTKCTSHGQCDSLLCLPDGSCAAEAQVAYVSASGTTSNCTKLEPCPFLKDALKNLPYIKIAADGASSDSAVTKIDGDAVSIFAEVGATISRTGTGAVLEVSNTGADVKIYNLRITGATGTVTEAHGILVPGTGVPKLALTRVKIDGNQGSGIYATGGSVTASQSTFANNAGGGIELSGASFAIVGNFFFLNGTAISTNGGLKIATTQSATNKLEFNSFNKNQTQDGLGTAIQCVAGTFTARNNIMSFNGTLTNMEQVSGSCSHQYSIARPGTVPGGMGNNANDPMFVNTNTGDLHLQPGSLALGAADPNTELTGLAATDVDGHIRMSPADIGADEVP